ncbi:SCO family protein [Alkalicoccobacillus porphyridii]|uniref:SCO family protein n=1 Tax=Alkalicoccobacillus porphyridii TaxID=2597270 RepID=A0A554A2B7_9BACI|nr:SCO family protein [Alkalicoccobacillus porphyridii]TSB47830.1 SCO family protein [Alkalicoccobacillus porphyridii]
MKKWSNANIFSFLVTFICLILLSGCNWVYNMDLSSSEDLEGVNEFNTEVPSFSFTDHNGHNMGTEQLMGEFWIAKMFFTNCPTVCPIMTPNMQTLQESTQAKNLDVSYVSFTVDPEYDNAEHLKKYGENVGADLSNWTFATGYEQKELAEFSKVAFLSPVEEVEGSEDIMHSTRFFLINPAGKAIKAYDGMMVDQDDILMDIENTVNEGL